MAGFLKILVERAGALKAKKTEPVQPVGRVSSERLNRVADEKRRENLKLLPNLESNEVQKLSETALDFAKEARRHGHDFEWLRRQISERKELRELSQKLGRKAFEPAFIASAETQLTAYTNLWWESKVSGQEIWAMAGKPEMAGIVKTLGRNYFRQLVYEIDVSAGRKTSSETLEKGLAIAVIENALTKAIGEMKPIDISTISGYAAAQTKSSAKRESIIAKAMLSLKPQEITESIKKFKREKQVFW